MPSLFINLRLSRKVNVFFMPPQLRLGNEVTFWLAVNIPRYLGMQDMPLLHTEDDVVFAPRFNRQLRNALQAMAPADAAKPHMLVLYSPEDAGPASQLLAKLTARQAARGVASRPQHPQVQVDKTHRSFWFGNQGLFFSPDMTQNVAVHFHQVLTGAHHVPGLSDMVLEDLLRHRARCMAPKQLVKELQRFKDKLVSAAETVLGRWATRALAAVPTGPRCTVLHTVPSLVQHVGLSSALFNVTGDNPRFHVALDFPGQLGFASLDQEGTW